MSKLGGSIDKLEGNLFLRSTRSLSNEGLSEGNDSLLDSNGTSFQDQKVFSDISVSGETSQRCNGLFGDIRFSGSRTSISSFSDSVNLLVDLGSVMITILTSTSYSEGDSRWMPCSNTGDLSETFVSLSGQFTNSPTSCDSLKSVSFGDSQNIDHLGMSEDGIDRYWLLEETVGEVNLLGDGSSVDLDFSNVGFLLDLDLLDLGVNENSDHSAVLLDSGQLSFDVVLLLDGFLGVFGEGLFLRSVPVLVKSSLDFVTEMVCPNGSEGSQSLGGGDVSDETNDNNGGCFDDGHSLNNFLLVELGAQFVYFTNNMGHTGLVTQKGGKMAWFRCVISGEGSYSTSVGS